MKQNSSLLAKMESGYVTTCFGLHLWPSSGYNLVALTVNTICLTFKNRASYIQDGRTATLQMLHFIYFFNKYKY